MLGSRNRLFNAFSINTFTLEEIENGTVSLLLKEAIALAGETSLAELAKMETAPLQNANSKHVNTGIGVSTRYQFTPIQLMKVLTAKGFTVIQICPIHIHGVPPVFKDQHPEVHASISNLLQNYATERVSLVPYSSSFMLHAKKAG